ncbi:MAG: anti-sigma factor family protein [Gemmatimonadaceae bacterium]
MTDRERRVRLGIDCARDDAFLSEYIDGCLSDSERAEVVAHVAGCELCRATLADLEAVRSWLRSDKPTASDEEAPDLWRDIRPRLEPRRSVATARRCAQIAAALLIVLGATRTAWRVTQPGPRPVAILAGAQESSPGRQVAPRSADTAVRDLEAVVELMLTHRTPTEGVQIWSALGHLSDALRNTERALAADPNDSYVAMHLARLRAKQLAVLRALAREGGA